MNKLFDINVSITGSASVSGQSESINMITFTAETESALFCGRTVFSGTDTQVTESGRTFLSARYMLEGTDGSGQECRLFIENNGSFDEGFRPHIVTDSSMLRYLEIADISAEVMPQDNGVTISLFINE